MPVDIHSLEAQCSRSCLTECGGQLYTETLAQSMPKVMILFVTGIAARGESASSDIMRRCDAGRRNSCLVFSARFKLQPRAVVGSSRLRSCLGPMGAFAALRIPAYTAMWCDFRQASAACILALAPWLQDSALEGVIRPRRVRNEAASLPDQRSSLGFISTTRTILSLQR